MFRIDSSGKIFILGEGKNDMRDGSDEEDVLSIAMDFFRMIAHRAQKLGGSKWMDGILRIIQGSVLGC